MQMRQVFARLAHKHVHRRCRAHPISVICVAGIDGDFKCRTLEMADDVAADHRVSVFYVFDHHLHAKGLSALHQGLYRGNEVGELSGATSGLTIEVLLVPVDIRAVDDHLRQPQLFTHIETLAQTLLR